MLRLFKRNGDMVEIDPRSAPTPSDAREPTTARCRLIEFKGASSTPPKKKNEEKDDE